MKTVTLELTDEQAANLDLIAWVNQSTPDQALVTLIERENRMIQNALYHLVHEVKNPTPLEPINLATGPTPGARVIDATLPSIPDAYLVDRYLTKPDGKILAFGEITVSFLVKSATGLALWHVRRGTWRMADTSMPDQDRMECTLFVERGDYLVPAIAPLPHDDDASGYSLD